MSARPVQRAVCLVGLLLLGACAEKVLEPPEDLIPEATMVEVLYELSLLNAASSVGGNALKEKGVEVMPYLFEKYSIDSLQFVTSDQYYASIPLTYEAMYKDVQARLEKKVSQIEALRKQRSDSIRKQVDRRRDSISNVGKETASDVPSEK